MRYGLSDKIMQTLVNELKKHGHIEKAILFGSRARGDYQRNSDIDLAVDCEGPLLPGLVSDLDEAAGIYKIDVINWRRLANENMRSNINKEGVIIYQRTHTQ